MVITFLGTGSAFCLKNYQPNLLIRKNGRNLLFDAGGDLRFSLYAAGYTPQRIESIYISHLHNDHIGGLEYLALLTHFDPKCTKPRLYGHKIILNDLWCHCLRGGLEAIEGRTMSLEDYFEVHEASAANTFKWNDLICELAATIHIHNGLHNMPVFGVMLNDLQFNRKVFISSDTQFTPEFLDRYYWEADVIVQDCESSPIKTGVHANYEELKHLSRKIKQKMYLWHYQDNVVEKFDHWQEKALSDGFAGFMKKGQEILIEKDIVLM